MRAMLRGALCLGAGGILLGAPFAASALPFSFGEIEGKFDTTLSMGATFRMQDADPTLIGISNGGLARSVNEDDGNLAFDKGDAVSAVAKATHDLELKWREFGLFTRFSYFYDAVAADADHRERRVPPGGFPNADRGEHQYELGARGRDRLESEIDLLDLFVYGRFDFGGGRTLAVRAGNQVVSWGESTFIQNGINAINPIDVARIRVPGSELKEALLPIPMLWASFQLTESLSMEAVWMTSYKKTEIDPRGSFFSTNDYVSDDGDRALVGFGRRHDDSVMLNPANPSSMGPGSAAAWVPRQGGPDVEDAEKQFGVALRYFAENLGSTEFGAYYLTYHSRIPLISGFRGAASSPANLLTPTPPPLCSSDAAAAGCRGSFFTEYPANIDLYGLSFNTDGPLGIALQGEYSFRPKQPIQLAGTEVLLRGLGVPGSLGAVPLPAGTYIQGWREIEMHQAQMTLTKAFGPMAGAQQFIMLGEVGVNHLALPDELRFNGPGAHLPACGFSDPATVLVAASNGSCQSDGFATDTSWGYRIVSRMDFENVVGAASLSPRLVFAHDVNGVGPNFNQDTKAVTVGVGFNYLQRWQADIGYTTFFGGRTYSGVDAAPLGFEYAPGAYTPGHSSQTAPYSSSANPNKDRDFLAISVSYAF
jgi:hypothetical protein